MKKILSLLVIAAVGFSCTDDDIKAEQNFTSGPRVVGFTTPFESVAYFADEGDVTREFPLDLVGGADGSVSSSDIVVNYTIDPASTATAGVEFDYIEAQGSITIPAGSSFGIFPLTVHTGSLNPTAKTELILNLTTASGAVVGEQVKKFKVVFVGCLSQLAGTYQGVFTNPAGSTTRNDEVISLIDINTFKTRYVGRYSFATFTPPGYEFVDICGEITIPEQNLGQYSNLVRGISDDGVDGHVTSATRFETIYEITFAAGNQTQTAVYNRN
jgi:hypothetical protein